MLAPRGRRARRPAQSAPSLRGVPARSPAAAGVEANHPGVYGKRSHAKGHLAARETWPKPHVSAPREQPVDVGTKRAAAWRLRTDRGAAAVESTPPPYRFYGLTRGRGEYLEQDDDVVRPHFRKHDNYSNWDDYLLAWLVGA